MLDVLIVGGGPVGLFLGCLLAQRGLRVQVLERRAEPGVHSRAIGIHPPALEAFEPAGLTQPLLDAGVRITRGLVRGEEGLLGELDFRAASPRYPFILSLPQRDTERLLERRLQDLAPGVLRGGAEVRALHDCGSHVAVTFRADGRARTVQARLVVGADGRRSLVRRLAGIGYPGGTYADKYLMGDFPDTTAFGDAAVIFLTGAGVVESFPLPGWQRRWVVRTATLRGGAQARDLGTLVQGRTGFFLPAGECTMLSAFEVRHHLAARLVAGRVLLVGDAAHEVSPIGGQGMNLGWLDAAALAPLLEEAVADLAAAGPALRRYERRRLRFARLATRQAEFNMLFGRPARGGARRVREEALRGLLSPPVQPLLARAFTMGWL
ncbi:FAD-dependent monooxygenase (plasmid) [Deinococcus metallilatus]|uniref:2-polyprenyl-6-methoxyphenol hydroxylase-like FAD-dependent oxidoreductase n=1 Tax=Deinococcus metallilatus TaxID=1211322 RepID=A0ABR6MYF2_9DEIO|nr:NAD(P)/FAD-dependent oxidoreductase [Deinococcus metallilatus]MBB5296971.1 2-polyprenyl-6-methoxyphenol hydroxylase-like FAD-dependent oxidoreductase [Deinococcus metallilatus]QBY06663.1 FAD-dependent monooxygenase [Deinococcus metallilatus]GMA15130.1 oxidoreductase [Deinococcus metallilatus]